LNFKNLMTEKENEEIVSIKKDISDLNDTIQIRTRGLKTIAVFFGTLFILDAAMLIYSILTK
tara:strand:- start:4168 stop:4353 length:186 start_codon:yes stop_codon:yes gene_type:complete